MSSPDIARLPSFDQGQQFELLVKTLSDYAIYMIDPEGFISSWNAGAEPIKGYKSRKSSVSTSRASSPTRIKGAGFPQKFSTSPALPAAMNRKAGVCARTANAFGPSLSFEAIRDENGALVGFGKVTRDITDRHESESSLSRASAASACWSIASSTTLSTCSTPSGHHHQLEYRRRSHQGLCRREVVGTHFSRFYTKEDRSRGLPAIAPRDRKDRRQI